MSLISNLIVAIRGDNADFLKKMSASENAAKQYAQRMHTIGNAMTLAVTAPLVGVGVAALKVSADLETNRLAFDTMLGSAQKSKKFLDELKQFALATPFNFMDLADASRRMLALGFSAEKIIPTVRSVGSAVAALGGGKEMIDRVTLALGQMLAKGRVQAEEMRQLAEAGIPAWEILAKKLGVDVATAMKMVEQRTVDSKMAIEALTADMDRRFGGAFEKFAGTAKGQFEKLKESAQFALGEMGDSIMPFATKAMQGLGGVISVFNQLPGVVKDATLALAAFAALSGPLTKLYAVLVEVGGAARVMALALTGNFIGPLPLWMTRVLDFKTALLGTAGAAAAIGAAVYVAGNKLLEWSGAMKNATDKAAASFANVQRIWDEAYGQKRGPSRSQVLNDALKLAQALDSESAKKLAGAFDQLGLVSTTTLTANVEKARYAVQTIEEAFRRGQATATDLARAKAVLAEESKKLELQFEKTGGSLKAIPFEEKSLANKILIAYVRELGSSLDELIASAAAMKSKNGVLYDIIGDPPKIAEELREVMRQIKLITPEADALRRSVEASVQLNSPGMEQAQTGGWAKRQIELNRKVWKDSIEAAKEAGKAQQALQREVDRAFDGMSRRIARNIVEWKGWKDSGIQAAKDMASGMLEIMIQRLTNPLKVKMADAVTSVWSKLPSWMGGGASAAGGAVNAASSAGGAAASAAGGAGQSASGAASGVMGTIGAIGAAVGAVSSIVGNFQMAGMNKTLDLLEKSMRYIEIMTKQIIDEFYHPYLPRLKDIQGYIGEMYTNGIKLSQWPGGMLPVAASATAGSGDVNISITGGYFLSDRAMDDFADALASRMRQRGLIR